MTSVLRVIADVAFTSACIAFGLIDGEQALDDEPYQPRHASAPAR